jgi:hypothetical protein
MLVTPHSADPEPEPEPGAGAVVVPGVVVVGGAVVEGGVTHRRGVVVAGGVVDGVGVPGAVVTGGVGVGVAGWAAAPPELVSTIRNASTAAAVAATTGQNRTGFGGGAWAEVVTVRLR